MASPTSDATVADARLGHYVGLYFAIALATVAGCRYARIVTPEELANLAHLRRARDLMDREYARPLDVATLARAALMSSAHFSRQFRAAYGETPYAYLMTRRIERAKALLRHGDPSVTEVCLAVGCSSLGSFSARFTELVGETPTAYRARDHSSLASVPGCVARDLTRPAGKPSTSRMRAEQDRRSARVAGSLALQA
jgi:AraC-like DNA-binding protein